MGALCVFSGSSRQAGDAGDIVRAHKHRPIGGARETKAAAKAAEVQTQLKQLQKEVHARRRMSGRQEREIKSLKHQAARHRGRIAALTKQLQLARSLIDRFTPQNASELAPLLERQLMQAYKHGQNWNSAGVVIKTAWERLCWESIFPCAEYSIVL
jgi:DNA repair exonuclease SbcCD ATPase subunit